MVFIAEAKRTSSNREDLLLDKVTESMNLDLY